MSRGSNRCRNCSSGRWFRLARGRASSTRACPPREHIRCCSQSTHQACRRAKPPHVGPARRRYPSRKALYGGTDRCRCADHLRCDAPSCRAPSSSPSQSCRSSRYPTSHRMIYNVFHLVCRCNSATLRKNPSIRCRVPNGQRSFVGTCFEDCRPACSRLPYLGRVNAASPINFNFIVMYLKLME